LRKKAVRSVSLPNSGHRSEVEGIWIENINCAKADWADLLEGVTIDTAIAVVWICGKGAPSVQVTCKTQSVT